MDLNKVVILQKNKISLMYLNAFPASSESCSAHLGCVQKVRMRFSVTVKSEFFLWAPLWEKKRDMLSEACDRCLVMFCTFAALFFWDDKTETFWNAKTFRTLSFTAPFSFFPFSSCFLLTCSCPPLYLYNLSLQIVTVDSVPCSHLHHSVTLLLWFFLSILLLYPTLALLLLRQILKQISHEISFFLHPLSSCRSLLASTSDIFAHSPLRRLRVLSALIFPPPIYIYKDHANVGSKCT